MFKLKIDKSSNKLTGVSPGVVDPVHTIRSVTEKGGKEEIDLSMFPQWDGLSIPQKRFIVEYSKRNLKRGRAALAAGVTPIDVKNWMEHNTNDIRTIYQHVIDLHSEGIEEVDYLASFDPKNNTSRGRWLSKRSEIYKENSKPKESQPAIREQTNILAVLNSADVTDKGLAGVQKMFNSLKEQGKLPQGMEVGQDNS